jgi:hypothetical protein
MTESPNIRFRFGKSSGHAGRDSDDDRQSRFIIANSCWPISLRVMETQRLKTLGTTQGPDRCPCWPKANLNPRFRFRRALFGDNSLTPANLLSFANRDVDHTPQFGPPPRTERTRRSRRKNPTNSLIA